LILSWKLFKKDLKAICIVGLPLVFNNFSSFGVNLADTLMASAFGPKQLAAVALGSGVWISLFLLGLGTLMSIGPSIAQHYGAGRYDEIGIDTKQGFWLALGVSVITIVIMRSFHPVYLWIGIDPEVSVLAQGYLDGLSWGVLGAFLYHTLKQMNEGVGNTVPIMIVMVGVLPINILINYCLMYGKFTSEPMGAPGCGLGSGLSFWLMYFLLYQYVRTSKKCRRFLNSVRPIAPNWISLKRLIGLGFPIGLSLFLQSSLFTSVALLMGSLGTQAIAAHQIVLNFSGLIFMLPLGLGMALTVCVGQSVGHGDLDSANRIGLTGIFVCLLISMITAFLTWTFAAEIVGFYTTDITITVLATQLLRVAAFLQVGDAVQTAAALALRGLKDTLTPMILNGLNYWGVGFLWAYLLGIVCGVGPVGIWLAITISLCLAGCLLVTRFILLLKSKRETKVISSRDSF